MNNEQLTAYLKDESYLYTLSYEELKTLVVQYPYATNLRVLLLKKSFIEQNKDYERNLQMAAAYSTNRRFLYKLVQKLSIAPRVPENVILGEDYLELTELSNIEKMLSERHVTQVFSDDSFSFAGGDSAPSWAELGMSDTEQDIAPSETTNLGIKVAQEDNSVLTESPTMDITLNNLSDKIEIEELPVDLTGISTISEPLNGVTQVLHSEPIFDDVDDTDEVMDLTQPLSDISTLHSSDVGEISEEVTQKVDLAIESILAEFGSLALDFSGKSTDLDAVTTPLSISFETADNEQQVVDSEVIDDEIADENIPREPTEEDDNTEIPLDWLMEEEPLTLEGLDTDFSTETNNDTIVDEEIKLFEELNENSEFNENQYFKNEPSFDFNVDDSHLHTENDFQSEDEIIENIIEQTPQYITQGLGIDGIYSEQNDMKKPEIEIEIVNQSKALIVESESKTPVPSSQVSFKDWLRQFKVQPKPIEEIKVEVKTTVENPVEPVVETETQKYVPTKGQHVLDENILSMLFEAPSELPDNLFGLNDVKFTAPESQPKDTSIDDSYFEKLLNGTDEENPKKKKKKKKQMHELAAKSIVESDDLISETLADILAWQGNIKKSIEMYEQLRLQFPEKNDYFAAKIEKLRNTHIE